MRKGLSACLGFVAAIAAAVALLTLLLDGLGGSADLMQSLMLRYAPPEATGLSADAYPAMNRMITGYLSGAADTFQLTLTDEAGEEQPCFNTVEQQHMADCRGLFVLDRQVMLLSLMLLAVCIGLMLLLRCRRPSLLGFVSGASLTLLLVLAAAVWGVVDFDGLFVLFHRLSFTNDLWLLNPATDLLIRLMPLRFFIAYAAILAITWLVFLLLLLFLPLRFLRRSRHPLR